MYSQLTFTEIARITRGTIRSLGGDEPVVRELLTDSRSLNLPEVTLFFAMVTRRNNGHKYIQDLYDRGVRSFVVSEFLPEFENLHGAWFIITPNTLAALQSLAAAHRKEFSLPVIGITGSNGKTIIKEWLYQLISPDKKVVRSPKSYNSQIGVPLSVWQIQSDDDLGIFEAGISEPEEMDHLQPIILPTLGIFTNIGPAHDENFIHLDQKISEKLKLFTKVETLIYCADHVEVRSRILQSPSFKKINFFTWGKRPDCQLLITGVVGSKQHTTIQAQYQQKEISITIPFIDEASVENAIHCWAVMLLLNYSQKTIAERMSLLMPVAMRLELKEGINNCSVINDSYSSDIHSLSIALDFLKQQNQHPRRTVVLSDVLQSGKDENELYGEIAGLLKGRGIDRIIGIGPAIGRQSARFKMEKSFFSSTADFLLKFPFSSFHNETILLKGARIFEFEQISKALQQKAHETVLEVNLNALVNNLNLIRAHLNPGVKTMVMVKAFSYGSGSFEIANILQHHHVDYLTVAYADEGVELRNAGILIPIMVMNPDEESIDAIEKYCLEPEIYSFRILDLLENSLSAFSGETGTKIPVHLKLDTGMHRLGFGESDVETLAQRLKDHKYIHVQSVFTHLAGSGDEEFDDFTRLQIHRFGQMSDRILEVLDYPVLRHVLNSAGIRRFPEAQFDMVRLGIALYGVPLTSNNEEGLENVTTLRTSVSQIRNLEAGETIGYNRSWRALMPMTMAVIPIGYADGLSRKLGNGKGRVFVGGELRQIIGDICMDMSMIDVTGLNISEGDEVIIFGSDYPLTQVAKDMETIPYEVLTSISRRVKRIYFQE